MNVDQLLQAAGFFTYRIILSDFIPGVAFALVLAVFLPPEGLTWLASGLEFFASVAGPFFVAFLVLAVLVGLGLMWNLLTAWLLDPVLAWKPSRSLAEWLYRKADQRPCDLDCTAERVSRLLESLPNPPIEPAGENEPTRYLQVQLMSWLRDKYQDQARTIDRYAGAAILSRALAGLCLVVLILQGLPAAVEAHQRLVPLTGLEVQHVQSDRDLLDIGRTLEPLRIGFLSLTVVVLLEEQSVGDLSLIVVSLAGLGFFLFFIGSAYASSAESFAIFDAGEQRLRELKRP